jgi:hyperosmotically inducible periplasmic protein
MQFRKTAFASGFALALAALSGPVAADTMSQDLTEARQESQIWTTYALNPHLKASDLKVSVQGGKATLTGTVEEGVSRDLAKQIALGVNGIREVDNRITIQPDYIPVRAPGRSYGEVVDDATITSAIKSKLLWSKHTDGLTTDVDTLQGRVTLQGFADNQGEKNMATRLAMNTRGVVSVDNQLVLSHGKPTVVTNAKAAGQGAKQDAKDVTKEARKDVTDSWITTKVKSSYLYSSNVDGTDISVSTRSGIVTLSGKVDSGAERALAIEIARNVRGVKNVHAKGLTL